MNRELFPSNDVRMSYPFGCWCATAAHGGDRTMRRIADLMLVAVLLVAMAVPAGAAEIEGKQTGTLWEQYPKMPSTITHDGRTQYLVAYDKVNAEGIYMDGQSLVAFVAGRDSIADANTVTIHDFAEVPAAVTDAANAAGAVMPQATPSTECEGEIDISRDLTKGGYRLDGWMQYNLQVEWTYCVMGARVLAYDGTAMHDGVCWNCTNETVTSGRISNPKVWVKGTWTFKYSCWLFPIRSVSRFIKGSVNRDMISWNWS